VDPERRCEFCFGERREQAIRKLIRAAKFSDSAANLARAEAASTLRSLGYSTDELLKARAHALDGHSLEQILAVLGALEMVAS
jgi:Holliday junction resolvasome RuvABC DNA-binding subunit